MPETATASATPPATRPTRPDLGQPPRLRSTLRALVGRRDRHRVLYATTFAFFLSFVVWFDFAPFSLTIARDLGLSAGELGTLTLANLALTVPARLVVGMLLDRFGPRRLYAGVLIFAAVPNTVFALAHSFPVLLVSRLLLGIVGAGFVVGIRLVAEWFEAEQLGAAEGLYGGWGNFGSAAAALLLPAIAVHAIAGPHAWRWAIGLTGALAAGYGLAFLSLVQDTPAGRRYHRPRSHGGLEVTSRAAVLGLCLMQVPIAGALALVAWRVERVHVIGTVGLAVALAAVTLLLGVQVGGVLRANRRALTVGYPPEDRYPFASVLVLALAYGVTFGTELAVISLLPTFFASTFALKVTAAGAAGSAFAFTNLVTRPGGGIASDISRSRRRVLISLMLGVTVSFVVLSTISHRWPVAAGIAVLALASVFVQAGNGAVFAMVPLVKRRVGGQIAGLAGAYGNIGGILLSSLLFFTATAHRDRRSGQMVAGTGDVRLMFLVIAGAALVVALVCRWLPEPAAHPATAADTAPGAAAPVGRETSAVATAP